MVQEGFTKAFVLSTQLAFPTWSSVNLRRRRQYSVTIIVTLWPYGATLITIAIITITIIIIVIITHLGPMVPPRCPLGAPSACTGSASTLLCYVSLSSGWWDIDIDIMIEIYRYHLVRLLTRVQPPQEGATAAVQVRVSFHVVLHRWHFRSPRRRCPLLILGVHCMANRPIPDLDEPATSSQDILGLAWTPKL